MATKDDDLFMSDGVYFDSLIPGLKEKARRIVHEKQLTESSDLFDRVLFFLSQYYNIPMYSSVFQSYTPEMLYYEYFLIQEHKKIEKGGSSEASPEEKTQEAVEVINNNRNELKGLFDDLRQPRRSKEINEEESPCGAGGDNSGLFSEEEQANAWNKIADSEGFF
jgi:hypothetical protein